MIEIWKPIEVLNNKYEVSSLGNVRNSKNKKVLYKETNELGYKSVRIQIKNTRKHYKIHRLVALAFIPNPSDYPQINHKDENPSNNNVENLEWCTNKYNSNYGKRNYKLSLSLRGKPKEYKNKKVIQYDLEVNVIKEFKSIKEAAKSAGVSRSTIRSICKQETKKPRKFIFKYREEDVIC